MPRAACAACQKPIRIKITKPRARVRVGRARRAHAVRIMVHESRLAISSHVTVDLLMRCVDLTLSEPRIRGRSTRALAAADWLFTTLFQPNGRDRERQQQPTPLTAPPLPPHTHIHIRTQLPQSLSEVDGRGRRTQSNCMCALISSVRAARRERATHTTDAPRASRAYIE